MMAAILRRKGRFGRRQAVILITLVVVTLAVYGAVIWCYVGHQGALASTAAASAGDDRLALPAAHQAAQSWAVTWQPDAQLVGVVTRWQLAGDERLTLYRPSWSFSFYSPAARQVQMVTVDQAGVQPVRQVAVSKAPVPVTADWSLDSDDLLLTFMAYGGEAFLREHARANLHVSLSAEDAEHSIWYLSAIDPESRQSFVIGIDARSREVVSTS